MCVNFLGAFQVPDSLCSLEGRIKLNWERFAHCYVVLLVASWLLSVLNHNAAVFAVGWLFVVFHVVCRRRHLSLCAKLSTPGWLETQSDLLFGDAKPASVASFPRPPSSYSIPTARPSLTRTQTFINRPRA